MASNNLNSANTFSTPSWLILLRAPSIALSGRVLLLASMGVMLVWSGEQILQYDRIPVITVAETGITQLAKSGVNSVGDACVAFVGPFLTLAQGERIGLNLLRCTLRLVVWGLLGGAILRIATLAYTRGENPNLIGAIKYSWLHMSGFLGGPILLLAGLLLIAAPLGLARLAMQATWFSAIAGVMWPVVLVAAVLATLYAFAAQVGWPLLMAATAADGSDSFDAVSRMFAYVYQKPLRLVGYVLLVAMLSIIASIVGQVFLAGVFYTSTIAAPQITSPFATSAIAWWNSLAVSLVSVYLTGLVFTSASGVYLLRRQDVDGVHTDEVFIDSTEYNGGLPPVSEDATCMPQLDEQPAEAA